MRILGCACQGARSCFLDDPLVEMLFFDPHHLHSNTGSNILTRIIYPVGHGGFHHERHTIAASQQTINVFYDCGAKSKDAINAVSGTMLRALAGADVHFAFISHLDSDHINGLFWIAESAPQLKIRTLVIPYLNEEDRAIHIADHIAWDEPNDRAMQVIRYNGGEHEGLFPQVSRVVRVGDPAGSVEDVAYDEQVNRRNISVRHEALFPVAGRKWIYKTFVPREGIGIRKRILSFLRKRRVLNASGEISGTVRQIRDRLEPIRVKLRKIYGSGQRVNNRSLVLGSYPSTLSPSPTGVRSFAPLCSRSCTCMGPAYVGYGDIKIPSVLAEMRAHFGPAVTERIGVVQTPHHGARGCYGKMEEHPNVHNVINIPENDKKHPCSTVLAKIVLNGDIPVLQRASSGILCSFIEYS